jgi:SAM-dependent methyltransferase
MKTDNKMEKMGLREKVRKEEFESIQHLFIPQTRVLELGGGSGYQAALMASLGCEVLSIDVEQRAMPRSLVFPVQNYNGKDIPADDKTFDIIYSSNVLEHIKDVHYTLKEVRRVLKPEGMVIHFLPSPAWRFWNSVAHYVNVVQRLFGGHHKSTNQSGTSSHSLPPASATRRHSLTEVLSWCFLGAFKPHGEYQNAIVELFSYRRSRWRTVFEDAGFNVSVVGGNGLFYSGYFLSGLSITTRRRACRLMGQSCNVFIMKLR